MADNGEEKLISLARHIAITLGHTDSMTDDILKIFSNFDGRLRKKLSDYSVEQTLKSPEHHLSRHISTDAPIWFNSDNPSSFVDSFDQLITAVRNWSSSSNGKSISACLLRAENVLQQCMLRLEDEFRSLLERGVAEYFNSFAGGSTCHPEYSDEDEDNDVSVVDEEDSVPVVMLMILS